MENNVTLTVDATASTVQVIAAEVLGYTPGVGGGQFVELTLAASDAARVQEALRGRGYDVTSETWARR